MTKQRTKLEMAAGKLISAIQKEWGNELGESVSDINEDVLGKGHEILQAAKNNCVKKLLNGMSTTQYLGDVWVRKHPQVEQDIVKFDIELKNSENV